MQKLVDKKSETKIIVALVTGVHMKILFGGFPINLITLVTGKLELWNVFSLSDFSAF